MSTKHLRAVVESALAASKKHSLVPEAQGVLEEAMKEVEAIERAAKTWWMRDDVMERIEDAGHGGFDVVRAIAKDAP